MKWFLDIHHKSMKLALPANSQVRVERNFALCYALYLKENVGAV